MQWKADLIDFSALIDIEGVEADCPKEYMISIESVEAATLGCSHVRMSSLE